MAVLGIESSAHTLGIGIADGRKIIANKRIMYPITDKGIIPSKVADFHAGNVRKALLGALRNAKISLDGIEAIAYTKGPGIGACLQVGRVAAKALSERLKVPLIPINHAAAHIEITKTLFGMRDPLALYVSGGNSQILAAVDKPYKHYHVYGETFDIGIGNMLDTFARAANLNPAWGSTVAKASSGGKYMQMPYTVKGMDFTFTGLLTNAINLLDGRNVRDVSYSLQETAFAMLCEATERALLLTNKREIILCGGVAQSTRLQMMVGSVASSHRARFGVASNEFNADNGAMIAVAAEKLLRAGVKIQESECTVSQRYRVEGAVIV